MNVWPTYPRLLLRLLALGAIACALAVALHPPHAHGDGCGSKSARTSETICLLCAAAQSSALPEMPPRGVEPPAIEISDAPRPETPPSPLRLSPNLIPRSPPFLSA